MSECSNILEILNQLEATDSRLAKEEILRQNADNQLLHRVLIMSMSPLLNFYIRKTPAAIPVESPEDKISLDSALGSLQNEIATRKLTGNNAIVFYAKLLGSLHEDDAIVLERVVKRDLRCGVKIATVNNVFGDDYIYIHPVLLCEKYSIKAINALFKRNPNGVYCQLKSDGARATISVYEDKVVVHTRNGEILDFKGHFDFLIPVCPGKVLDGELLAVDEFGETLPRKISNGVVNRVHHGTATDEEIKSIYITAWDCIPLGNFTSKKKTTIRYADRWNDLAKICVTINHKNLDPRVQLIESVLVNTYEEAKKLFTEWMKNGEEGAILKSPDLQWEHKRSKDAIKIKAEETADLEVVGWEFGKDDRQFTDSLGALIGETRCGLLQVNVGSGFSEEERHTFLGTDPGRVEYFENNWKTNKFSQFWSGRRFDKNAFLENMPTVVDQDAITAGLKGKIFEMLYNEKIKSDGKEKHSLFLPRFVEMRTDKDEANTMEELA